MLFDNYVSSVTCKEHKLLRGLPSVQEFEKHLNDNNSPNWYFQFGDGSLMTCLWGHVLEVNGKKEIEWYKSGETTPLTSRYVDYLSHAGYSWPVDKYGNKTTTWDWVR